MSLINTKCPECGAALKINENAKGRLTCPYCGSEYLVEQALNVTNVTVNVTQDNYQVETKIVDYVEDESYRSIISQFESFGWNVKSAQKTDFSTSNTTGNGNYVSTEIERTLYWTITFQRSLMLPCLGELKNLQKEYDSLSYKIKAEEERKENLLKKRRTCMVEYLAVDGILLIISGLNILMNYPTWGRSLITSLVCFIIFTVMLFLIICIRCKKVRKIKQAIARETYELNTLFNERKIILIEAQKIVDEQIKKS